MSSLVVREFRAYIVVLVVISTPKEEIVCRGLCFFCRVPGCLSKKIEKTIKIFRVLEKAHVFV